MKKQSRNEKLIWSLYAYCYDGLLVLKSYRDLLKLLKTKSGLKPGDKVIDIGVGTGNFESLVADSGVEMHCLDFSREMMARAEKKNPKLRYYSYDINRFSLPFEHAFADKVVSCNVVYNVKDLERFFLDINRVLKNDGLLVFTTSTKSGLAPIIKNELSNINRSNFFVYFFNVPKLALVYLINIFIDMSRHYYFYTGEELSSILGKTGFAVLENVKCYEGLNNLYVARKTDSIRGKS